MPTTASATSVTAACKSAASPLAGASVASVSSSRSALKRHFGRHRRPANAQARLTLATGPPRNLVAAAVTDRGSVDLAAASVAVAVEEARSTARRTPALSITLMASAGLALIRCGGSDSDAHHASAPLERCLSAFSLDVSCYRSSSGCHGCCSATGVIIILCVCTQCNAAMLRCCEWVCLTVSNCTTYMLCACPTYTAACLLLGVWKATVLFDTAPAIELHATALHHITPTLRPATPRCQPTPCYARPHLM
jgi:hypothetical protein